MFKKCLELGKINLIADVIFILFQMCAGDDDQQVNFRRLEFIVNCRWLEFIAITMKQPSLFFLATKWPKS